jgi:hypothetical protein
MRRCFLCALLISIAAQLCADEPTRRAQEELRKRNLYFGDINGQTNPELIEALKRYQERKGFEPTGQLDEETGESLKIRVSPLRKDGEQTLPDVPVLKSDIAREIAAPDQAQLQPNLEPETTPSTTPAAPPAESRSETNKVPAEQITNFVRQFLHDAEVDDVDLQVRYFAFPVEYFDHGQAGRDFVAKDTRNYIKRWPQRHYSLIEPVKIETKKAAGDFQIEFVIDFQVAGAGRKAHGKTRNLWTIQSDRENFKILAINEQRLHD